MFKCLNSTTFVVEIFPSLLHYTSLTLEVRSYSEGNVFSYEIHDTVCSSNLKESSFFLKGRVVWGGVTDSMPFFIVRRSN